MVKGRKSIYYSLHFRKKIKFVNHLEKTRPLTCLLKKKLSNVMMNIYLCIIDINLNSCDW